MSTEPLPTPGVAGILYRLIRSNPPTVRDFLSNAAQGKALDSTDPELLRRWAGVSMFDTVERARQNASRRPYLGSYIAEVRVEGTGRVTYGRTGNTRGHYTVWGDAEELSARVVTVMPAGGGQPAQ